jgi:RNA polymerase sigma-70 factor (ECF subfamily)
MAPTDEELLVRAADGDAEAFGPVMERHAGSVLRYLRRMAGSAEAAEELLQQTFVAAFLARRQYRGEGSARAWLMTIARNRARNALRDQARTIVDEQAVAAELERLPSAADSPEDEVLRGELRGEIAAALALLPPACREAVVLRDVEGFSYPEIAGITGATEGAVRVRVHRGREQLQELLAPYLRGEPAESERSAR